jgi:Cu(I)/Ag(I) efflux system membrane protein CusA/SilA
MKLMVYPVIYYLWRGRTLDKSLQTTSDGDIEEG